MNHTLGNHNLLKNAIVHSLRGSRPKRLRGGLKQAFFEKFQYLLLFNLKI